MCGVRILSSISPWVTAGCRLSPVRFAACAGLLGQNRTTSSKLWHRIFTHAL
jgi:hypothetical protein